MPKIRLTILGITTVDGSKQYAEVSQQLYKMSSGVIVLATFIKSHYKVSLLSQGNFPIVKGFCVAIETVRLRQLWSGIINLWDKTGNLMPLGIGLF